MKIGHVRLSCFDKDNRISPEDLMAYTAIHALTMSGSQHRFRKSRKAAVINKDVIVYVLAQLTITTPVMTQSVIASKQVQCCI